MTEMRKNGQNSEGRKKVKRYIEKLLCFLAVVYVIGMFGVTGWKLVGDVFSIGEEDKTVAMEVTEEDTVKTVTDKLEKAGLIRYKWLFGAFADFYKADEKIDVGVYDLNTNMNYRELVTGMHDFLSDSMEVVTVTIPEGLTVERTIALLAENGVNTEDSLLTAAKTADFDYEYIDNESEDITRLEGFLFPDTYEFYKNDEPENILGKMISNFDLKLDKNLLAQATARGYSVRELVTIASLIEEETDGTDHKTIASVIYNRLEGPGDKGGTNGLLQIDASLLYIQPEHSEVITQAMLETDSPYNLYKNAGLPPTPIANPGLQALEAALSPETTEYYYYALGADGKHHFFATYEEHSGFVNSEQYGG